MKKDEVKLGATYLAKVTDQIVPVRLDAVNPHGGWDATNLKTNKKVRIKSAQRLRGPARDDTSIARSAGWTDGKKPTAADPDLVPLSKAMPAKKATKGKKPKAAPAKVAKPNSDKPKRPSGLDSAAQILKTTGEPMRCKDLVDKMLADGLWKTNGKTPAATIYAAILREITTKGSDTRFKKTDRGLFAFNGK